MRVCRGARPFSEKRRRQAIIDESAGGDFSFLPGYLHRYNALISTKEKTGWTWV
jgi:hypothetical protein